MFYKLNLFISGENISDKMISIFQNNFITERISNKYLSLLHPNISINLESENIEEYQNYFFLFIEENYQLILDNGGKNINIEINLYTNDEINSLYFFNDNILRIINKYRIKLILKVQNNN